MPKQILENAPLIKEWLLDKNSELGLDPSKLTIGCGKKAWWKCHECGYEWKSKIRDRKYSGCRSCHYKNKGKD